MSKQVTKSTKTEKTAVFIVLGFDDQRKPRGARYVEAPAIAVATWLCKCFRLASGELV